MFWEFRIHFCSAPPFTGPRRHAIAMHAVIERLTYPQHSRSALLRCAVLAYWFDNGFSRMLERVPVHGMQTLFELQKTTKAYFGFFSCAGHAKHLERG